MEEKELSRKNRDHQRRKRKKKSRRYKKRTYRLLFTASLAVAAALDALNWQEIAGCIAGDDTVFCAVRTADDAMLVMEKLRRALNGGKRNS